jgi:Subtilase family
MPEPNTNWFFQPRRRRNGAGSDDGNSAPGLIGLPSALLQRHGAKLLDPERAVAVHGYPPPRPTVYRARTLLVPGDLQTPAAVRALNAILARVGITLIPSRPSRDTDRDRTDIDEALARLPRPVALVPAKDLPVPAVVDAWVALQTLRAAAAAPVDKALAQADLDEVDVKRITLEHLLVGSAIDGSPATHSGGGLVANPNDSSGVTGPSSTDSYVFSGGDTRTPVALLLDPPRRGSAADATRDYGRRPMIAVLDTGVRAHPWLEVKARPGGGYDIDPNGQGDGFITVDHDIQKAILAEGTYLAEKGDKPRQVIRNPWDTPITADPLVGELDTDTGHCTFISGIVRQVAPEARVLAVRIMHSDGAVYEGDLICALRHLAKRIALAEEGHPDKMVDVVSLSLGYFDETEHDVTFSSGLWKVIKVLLDLGVVVVAAAGNYSTSRKFYPAAFAAFGSESPADQVPLISVGALNPNGSKAVFSDGGHWITAWASGAVVVSTYPVDINASRTPELRMRAHPANPMPRGAAARGERESLDPDDYSGGFAVWSGTSFSAPLLAARFIRALLEGAAGSGLKLTPCGQLATANRAQAALKAMDWPG